MTALEQIRQLWRHASWADAALLAALKLAPGAAEAWREYAHILGADAVWLARLQGEGARTAVWPALGPAEVEALAAEVHAGFEDLLAGLGEGDLERGIGYTNSAGQRFTSAQADILLQALLHGQYHRGKVNALLRQAGAAVAAVDYIGFVRGVPAATTPRE